MGEYSLTWCVEKFFYEDVIASFRCCIMMTVVLFDGCLKSVRDIRHKYTSISMEAERVEWRDRTWTKAGKDQKGCEHCWMDWEEGICRSGWQPKKKKNWGETCSSDVVSDPLLCKYYVRRRLRLLWWRLRWGGVKEDFIMEYENLFLAALLVALLYEKKTCLIFLLPFLWHDNILMDKE